MISTQPQTRWISNRDFEVSRVSIHSLKLLLSAIAAVVTLGAPLAAQANTNPAPWSHHYKLCAQVHKPQLTAISPKHGNMLNCKNVASEYEGSPLSAQIADFDVLRSSAQVYSTMRTMSDLNDMNSLIHIGSGKCQYHSVPNSQNPPVRVCSF